MTGSDDGGFGTVGEAAGHGGGWLATAISAVAFMFSGVSFYMSALQQADLAVYVPPVLQYARDSGGEVDVFAIPVTIANNGANTGAVLAMELVVENRKAGADPSRKTFYAAFVGEHPREAEAVHKAFAPIAVPGRATFSETIRFFPRDNPLPKIVQEAGEYKFTLSLVLAAPSEPSWLDRVTAPSTPSPLVFERTVPYISEQHLAFRRGTMAMHAKDWKPTVSGGR
ncbi:MAG: hypothetical protein SFW09_09215 [Hyphomicrobiaceae bacterium]|nr:hypothetical protein [Hyphomicrobiaceae bacterium]